MIPRERVISVLEGEKPDKVPISILGSPHPYAALRMIDEMDELRSLRWLPQYQLLHGKLLNRELPERLKDFLALSVQGIFPDMAYKLGCEMMGILPPFGELDLRVNLNGKISLFGTRFEVKNGVLWRVESGEFPVKTAEDKDEIKPVPCPTDNDYTKGSFRDSRKKFNDRFLICWVPGPWEALEQFMGMENLMMSMVEKPDDMKELLNHATKVQLKTARPMIKELDGVVIGDDYGHQESLQISKEMWHEFIMPNLEEMVSELRKDGYVFLHSCGHIEPLIPNFLDIGFDAINPIQESANNLEKILRQHDLILLGGIDVQKTLPRKKPQEVKKRIKEIMEAAYPRLILADTNAITNETPPSNLKAVFEAREEFSKSLS